MLFNLRNNLHNNVLQTVAFFFAKILFYPFSFWDQTQPFHYEPRILTAVNVVKLVLG
jgi:hypothetical protein